MIRGILLLFIIADLIFVGLDMGLSAEWILDPASFVIVVGGTVNLLIISFPYRALNSAIGFVFSTRKELPRTKFLMLSNVYRATGEFFLFAGAVGTFIGFVLMLTTFDSMSTLGPKLAVALITILYGISGKLFAVLILRKLEMCIITDEEFQPYRQYSPLLSFSAGTIVMLLFIVLGIQAGGGGGILVFIDPASLFLVVGCSVFVALLFSPPKIYRDSFKIAFSKDSISLVKAEKAVRAFTQFRDSIMSMVIIVSIVALLFIVSSNLEASTLGPKIAVGLLSQFYGILLVWLVQALSYNVQMRLVSLGERIEIQPLFSDYFIILFSIIISFLIWVFLVGGMIIGSASQ